MTQNKDQLELPVKRFFCVKKKIHSYSGDESITHQEFTEEQLKDLEVFNVSTMRVGEICKGRTFHTIIRLKDLNGG